ncbi:MAG: GNAT family N-acetyltransferase [Halobacteriaceae archaeon]
MADLRVRRYRPDDDARVRELYAEALRAAGTDPAETPPETDLDDVPGTYFDGGTFLVGEVDGRVVATGALERVDETAAELRRMRVDPDRQRRGYGRAVLDELEARARDLGYDRLVLETAAHQGAVPFYEAAGYDETGRRRWKQFELVAMEKRL